MDVQEDGDVDRVPVAVAVAATNEVRTHDRPDAVVSCPAPKKVNFTNIQFSPL